MFPWAQMADLFTPATLETSTHCTTSNALAVAALTLPESIVPYMFRFEHSNQTSDNVSALLSDSLLGLEYFHNTFAHRKMHCSALQ